MEAKELKHVIALLLEDAKRLQELEPNAGTEARIWFAKSALSDSKNEVSIDYSVLNDIVSEGVANNLKNRGPNSH